jgi:hypothetical protein
MLIIIKADHLQDKLGDEYLESERVKLSFEIGEEVVAMKIDGIEGEFFIPKNELLQMQLLR